MKYTKLQLVIQTNQMIAQDLPYNCKTTNYFKNGGWSRIIHLPWKQFNPSHDHWWKNEDFVQQLSM